MNIQRFRQKFQAVIDASNAAHDVAMAAAQACAKLGEAYAALATANAEFTAECEQAAVEIGEPAPAPPNLRRRH